MASIKIKGDTSGSTTISAPDTGTDETIELSTALASKLDASEYVDWTAYSPTFVNLTVGNGTSNFNYARIGNIVTVQGLLTLGSTSAITGSVDISPPVASATSGFVPVGSVLLRDISPAVIVIGTLISITSTTFRIIAHEVPSGTFVRNRDLAATVPFTWATGDRLYFNFTYEAA